MRPTEQKKATQSRFKSPHLPILIGLMAPSFLNGMNHHSFSIILPVVRQEFGLDADLASWVDMAGTLPFIAVMPLYGRLGDHLGKRRLLVFGMITFLIGTILILLSSSLWGLMLGRVVQGLGTAGFVPLCMAIISQRFPPTERGRMMGTWNSVIPLTGLTLPLLGGLLIDRIGWWAIYPLMLLVGVFAIFLVRRNIPARSDPIDLRYLRNFDWLGVGLLGGALIMLFFYTSSRPITGVPALQDPRPLAICLLLFGALIYWERRRPQPYVNLSIFKNRTFTLTSICAGLRMMLMTSTSFLLPLYLSDIHDLAASEIGIALALQATMLLLISRAGGQLADRWGSRRPIVISMVGMFATLVLLAMLPASAPWWLLVLCAALHGLLIGLSLAPLHRAAMQDISEEETGMAAGLYSMIRFGGIVLGTAIAGVLLQQGLEQAIPTIQAYQIVFWGYAGIALVNMGIGWGIGD